ncbi:MAG: hypothetical protein MUD08_02225 [Cytophagales bacterium]|jgi:hypothetical protein|nr:hypothetical protein [Cytophagales bacterium]
MRKTLLVFLFATTVAAAQNGTKDSVFYSPRELDYSNCRWVVKWAPFSLIDFDRTVQFAAEYVITPTLSVQQELGYGYFRDFFRTQTTTTDPNGNTRTQNLPRYRESVFRSRTELRLYFISRYAKNPRGAYMAFEVFYKYANQPQEREVNMGSFFQVATYARIKNVYGGHLKIGGQVSLSPRVLLDMYFGIGVRTINLRLSDWPATAAFPDESLFDREPGIYSVPSAAGGFKIGYLLQKPRVLSTKELMNR